ncbi:MAG: DUF3072 domain-containing protein [Planctomycetes bacterium]|nr:DUF3072 domain-containing protein [Planctomycetota bacterium]
MAGKKQQNPQNQENPLLKNPDEWVTGDEPMTDAQRAYVHTLARQAGEKVEEEDLTKAEASKKIDDLREKTGRDTNSGQS